jgi:capsule polysaccharide export protein KpsC/LpsZ
MIETDGIFLSHHTNFKNKNIWNIKKGYINGYLNFDRHGYSGWAEIADSEKLFHESQEVEYSKALAFFEKFANDYINGDRSKIKQSTVGFDLNTPYVFVAGQRPHDTVAQHSKIDTVQLMKDVINAYKDTNYKVVVKVHPLEIGRAGRYSFLDNNPNVIVTDASIHTIIPKCTAVYTVNSGVGFEALLHRKRVFTSGHCDYHWVTTVLENKNDVIKSIVHLDEKIDEEALIKFVYYMLNIYFVNAYSEQSIKDKINLTIEEYNK